jgi:hypothetical protein
VRENFQTLYSANDDLFTRAELVHPAHALSSADAVHPGSLYTFGPLICTLRPTAAATAIKMQHKAAALREIALKECSALHARHVLYKVLQ